MEQNIQSPYISVVMAVHNEPPAILDAAISSILQQTVQDRELVICDDGSQPDTAAALQRWADESGVTLLRNSESHGAAHARNRCLSAARGQYIAIMDADDLSAPERLEQQSAFLDAHPEYAFVGCRGNFFRSSPGDRDDGYWYVARPQPEDFLMTLPFVHASLLFRRQALEAVGGYRESKRVRRAEDYDLLMRLYAAGLRGANLPHTLYHIRMDDATLQRRKYRYRRIEAAVKWQGFRSLGLMPRGALYAFKPLIVGLIPQRLLEKIKTQYYQKREK